MPLQSNQEVTRAVAELIDRWCEKRKLAALHAILPGYLALNGLTDGWYELLNSLKATRALGHEYFERQDWDLLSELISAVDQMLMSR
jgi:hypothetical protein